MRCSRVRERRCTTIRKVREDLTVRITTNLREAMSADPIALMEKLTVPLMGIVKAAQVAMIMAGMEIVRVVITVKGAMVVPLITTPVKVMRLMRATEKPTLPLRMGMVHKPVPFERDVHGWVRHV